MTRSLTVDLKAPETFALFSLAVLSSLNSSAYKTVGMVSLAATLGLALLFGLGLFALSAGATPARLGRFWGWVALFIAINVLSALANPGLRSGLFGIGQFVSVVVLYVVFACTAWNGYNTRTASGIFALYVLGMAAAALASRGWRGFAGYFTNPNSLGAIAFISSYFLALGASEARPGRGKLLLRICLLLAILLAIASRTRSILLSLVVTVITYWRWEKVTRSQRRFERHIVLWFAAILGGIAWYLVLSRALGFETLAEVIQAYTGKMFFSGRQRIWMKVLELASQKLLLGYGPGAVPEDFIGETLSAHNTYIQILFQNGVPGLIAFLLLIREVWVNLSGKGGLRNQVTRISGAYIIGFLAYQGFEVSITQNVLSFGIFFWIIAGIGSASSRLPAGIARRSPA